MGSTNAQRHIVARCPETRLTPEKLVGLWPSPGTRRSRCPCPTRPKSSPPARSSWRPRSASSAPPPGTSSAPGSLRVFTRLRRMPAAKRGCMGKHLGIGGGPTNIYIYIYMCFVLMVRGMEETQNTKRATRHKVPSTLGQVKGLLSKSDLENPSTASLEGS